MSARLQICVWKYKLGTWEGGYRLETVGARHNPLVQTLHALYAVIILAGIAYLIIKSEVYGSIG